MFFVGMLCGYFLRRSHTPFISNSSPYSYERYRVGYDDYQYLITKNGKYDRVKGEYSHQVQTFSTVASVQKEVNDREIANGYQPTNFNARKL